MYEIFYIFPNDTTVFMFKTSTLSFQLNTICYELSSFLCFAWSIIRFEIGYFILKIFSYFAWRKNNQLTILKTNGLLIYFMRGTL